MKLFKCRHKCGRVTSDVCSPAPFVTANQGAEGLFVTLLNAQRWQKQIFQPNLYKIYFEMKTGYVWKRNANLGMMIILIKLILPVKDTGKFDQCTRLLGFL